MQGFLPQQTHIVIEPSHNRGKIDLKELFAYRSLIKSLIVRDLKTRYKQQALGPLWLFIGPFFSMVVSSFIFGTVAKLPSEGVPYPIFLYTGTLTWGFFSVVYSSSMGCLISFIPWLQRIYIPRLVAPIITVALALVDWAIQIGLLLLLIIFYQIPIRVTILAAPLFLLVALIVGGTIGLATASITVIFRDFPNILGYGITAWYYATPVLYSATLVPTKWTWLYQMNPLYWVVEGMRWSILGIGRPPDLGMVLPVLVFIVLFPFSVKLFLYTSGSIVDKQ